MTKNLPEEKLPRKQYTCEWQSAHECQAAENYGALIEALQSRSGIVDAARSRLLSKRAFSYVLRLTRTQICSMVWLKSDAMSLVLCRKTADPAGSKIRLVLAISGKHHITQRGETSELTAGNFLLIDPATPLTHTFSAGSELFAVTVSDDYFLAHSGLHAQTFLGKPMTGDVPIQRFFARQLESIAHGIGTIDARDAGDVCDGIFCLLRPVMLEISRRSGGEFSSAQTADQWRSRVVEVLQHHFRSHELI